MFHSFLSSSSNYELETPGKHAFSHIKQKGGQRQHIIIEIDTELVNPKRILCLLIKLFDV